MRHISRIVLWVGLSLLVIGLALMGMSALTGGGIDSLRNNVAIRDLEFDLSQEQVTALDLELNGGRLHIVEGDSFRVEAKNVAEAYFVCRVDNGTLTVSERWTGSWAVSMARALSLFDQESEITLYIPADTALRAVALEINAGACAAQALSADTMELEMSAGSCTLEGLTVDTMNTDISAGALTVNGLTAGTCDLELSAGSVKMNGEILTDSEFETSAGSLTLVLSGSQDDYSFDVDMSAGSVEIGSRKFSGADADSRVPGVIGSPELELSCSAGSIKVSFAQ